MRAEINFANKDRRTTMV